MRIRSFGDNRDAADGLRHLLELEGHEVEVTDTGPDGVERAQAWTPDAVLSDLVLPGMDGFAVARRLRQPPATAKARIVAVTADDTDADLLLAKASGFDQFWVKPVDPEAVHRLIREARRAGAIARRGMGIAKSKFAPCRGTRRGTLAGTRQAAPPRRASMLSPNTPGQALRALVVDGYADAADSLVLLLELWGTTAGLRTTPRKRWTWPSTFTPRWC
jgi:CheY-like chemotaxis protein